MPRATILVGFAEALAAPEVVWSLVDGGFQVVAFARRGRVSALRHSHHVVVHEITPPETNLEQSISDLRSLLVTVAAEHGAPHVLFPLDDTAVWLCSRADLGPHWQLAGPRGDQADLALNKEIQTRLAAEAGLRVPATAVACNIAELMQACDATPFPLILKPVECVPVHDGRIISSKIWICANRGEAERAAAEWRERLPLLVQPFITGTGEGAFGLAAQGGIRAWSGHRRVRMMNPQGSGSSACVSQPVAKDLQLKAERLFERSGWQGLFMIELLRDAAGDVWFVEMNGRPWGSMALARRQGLEYPAWQVELALDASSPAGLGAPAKAGILCKHVGREIMHLLFVLRGPKSKALKNWPRVWPTLAALLKIRRGDSFYNWRREDPKVFLADCYFTVHRNLFKERN